MPSERENVSMSEDQPGSFEPDAGAVSRPQSGRVSRVATNVDAVPLAQPEPGPQPAPDAPPAQPARIYDGTGFAIDPIEEDRLEEPELHEREAPTEEAQSDLDGIIQEYLERYSIESLGPPEENTFVSLTAFFKQIGELLGLDLKTNVPFEVAGSPLYPGENSDLGYVPTDFVYQWESQPVCLGYALPPGQLQSIPGLQPGAKLPAEFMTTHGKHLIMASFVASLRFSFITDGSIFVLMELLEAEDHYAQYYNKPQLPEGENLKVPFTSIVIKNTPAGGAGAGGARTARGDRRESNQ